MKKLIYLTMLLGIFLAFNACSSDDDELDKPQTEQPDEPGTDPDEPNSPDPNPDAEKTLIVYYSFTNNVHSIVNDLRTNKKGANHEKKQNIGSLFLRHGNDQDCSPTVGECHRRGTL